MSTSIDRQHKQRHPWFELEQVIQRLETIQNVIVVILSIALFCFMVIRLGDLFLSMLVPLGFQKVTSDILFILILVELFRLLIIYLKEQRISVGVAVEVSIVSVLREVIIRGALEIAWQQILAICAFLLVLGGLLLIRAWMARIFNRIEMEKKQAVRDNQVVEEDRLLFDDMVR
ncbi:phosphate-starvation-inducible PsiE family protein [Chroococcidiopsis sp. TS-821]|uniref:phosphate-starvation-inducible PsiE family protein n=1 Tax=Chroococcidiopsis sp. TS-821 TaxID=1378066 RepID=UPI000CED9169|nr:phosphate-starvation-inducible PsiE family protein [Chroococcidiopsis sp. TS-821]PPS42836.1 hypothetical protein B1A85_14100 [Chroococcidiopsis sp. TS-821]